MQDDLFGDVPLQPLTDSSNNAAAYANPDFSVLRSMAKVLPAPAGQEWSALARQLPAQLRFGVSTWSYPGWEGLVWHGEYDSSVLSKHGLGAYHQHPLLRTVCVDRTFWRPLTASQYAAYAGQVDDDFRFVVKCPASVTDAQVRGEEGKAREPNPGFLDPRRAIEDFVQPALEGLGAKLGVLVFQLSPLPWGWLSRPASLLEKLDRMLAAVRQALPAQDPAIVAVEVRDPELLGRALVDTLKAHG